MAERNPSHIQAVVEDTRRLRGNYIRNMRDDRIYKIIDTGPQGVTVRRARDFGGEVGGPEVLITWRAVKALYSIMVHVCDIDEVRGK